MERNSRKALLGAAVAGLLSAGLTTTSHAGESKTAKAAGGVCVEKNGCSGKGSCKGMQGGKEHGCKGQNSCSQNERVGMTEESCKKIGGTFKKT